MFPRFAVLWLCHCLSVCGLVAGVCASAEAQQNAAMDQRLFKAAPEQCVAYSAWNSAATGDANSENATLRLLAEAEVQVFLADIMQRAGRIAPALLEKSASPEFRAKVQSLSSQLLQGVFQNEGCFFLETFEINGEAQFPKVEGALLMKMGGNYQRIVGLMSEVFTTSGVQAKRQEIAGRTFVQLTLGGDAESGVKILVGAIDDFLIVGVGEKTIKGLLQRFQGDSVPQWLTSIQATADYQRLNSLGYINAEQFYRTFAQNVPEEVRELAKVLGLDRLSAIESSAGFSATESVGRSVLRFAGTPSGLFDLQTAAGLGMDESNSLPGDSLYAVQISLDPVKILQLADNLSRVALGGRGDSFDETLEEINRELGVDVRALAKNLQGTWTVYNGAGDGWGTGTLLSCSVSDGPALQQQLNELLGMWVAQSDGSRYAPAFFERKQGKDTILSVKFPSGIPFELSWSVSGNRFLLALFPQTLQTALADTPSEPSTVDQYLKNFVEQSKDDGDQQARIVGLGYSDTQRQFEILYPYVQIALSFSSQWLTESNGFSEHGSEQLSSLLAGVQLPPARSIHKHLRPSVMVLRQTGNRLVFESRQTLPTVDAAYAIPLAAAVMFPAIEQTRGAARQAQSANNLRQIALACLNYESAYQRFPAAYSLAPDGNPLLSWRVAILPFIEEMELYDQFKRDEPWDSPHNIKLLEKMPAIFRSPNSKSRPGTTVYLGVGGPNGALGGRGQERKIRFADIVDGSSNTILAMETSDALAMEWTKPDDGILPEAFALEKLFGQYPDGTNAIRCDGSWGFLPATISQPSLKNLLQINDGNIVEDYGQRTDVGQRTGWGDASTDSDRRLTMELPAGVKRIRPEDILLPDQLAEMSQQSFENELKSIGLAIHNYESAYNRFPQAYTVDTEKRPLLSWRVEVLPYLDEAILYQQFRQKEPWDSAHNLKLLESMPAVFRVPGSQAAAGKTTVMGVGGSRGIISAPFGPTGLKQMVQFKDVLDGLSNTAMLIVVSDEFAVEWTKPTEFSPDLETLRKILAAQKPVVSILGDGRSERIDPAVSAEALLDLLQRDEGNVLAPSIFQD